MKTSDEQTILLSGVLRETVKLPEPGARGERLIVDCSGLESADYNGMIALMTVKNRFLKSGAVLELRGMPENIQQIIRMFRIPL